MATDSHVGRTRSNIPTLPTLAFIEAQIIHRAARTPAFAQIVRAVEREQGMEDGSLGSGVFLESRVAALLYCLIVFPKEMWPFDEKHDVYKRIEERWSVDRETTVTLNDTNFANSRTYGFVYHLRNAVSHANFSMENGRFEFWDRRNDKAPVNFRASLPIESLQRFLETVGPWFANLMRRPVA